MLQSGLPGIRVRAGLIPHQQKTRPFGRVFLRCVALNDQVRQGLHVLHPYVRLVRGATKRAVATIDEGAAHAGGFCTQAVEGMVGNEQDFVQLDAHDLGRFGVGGNMRLERVRFGDGDDVVERIL